jgi:co-chaperonin GroES (HSP10)
MQERASIESELPPSFRPLRDRVVIRRVDLPERVGMIYVPDVARVAMQVGVVVAVGNGPNDEHGRVDEPEVAVGEVVIYTGAWQGHDVERDGRRYRTLDRYQIAAVIDEVPDPDHLALMIRHLG